MRKMVYLPYVRFEQEEGEAEGIGWYFTQYNAETGEGRDWHGTEFMPRNRLRPPQTTTFLH